MTNLTKFTIDIEHCTCITMSKEFDIYDTDVEKIMAILKHGTCKGSSTWTEDHPEFAKLREYLNSLGYIKIERSWWNGDRVIKPFMLNNKEFKKGDTFYSANAIRWVLEH